MAVRPPWIDGVTKSAADIRLAEGGLLTPTATLRAREGALGAPVVVSAQSTPDMTVSVPAFVYVVDADGFGGTSGGPVLLVNDGPVTKTISPASGTNPRRDLIVARWVGEENASASSRGVSIDVVTGTAATVPSLPAAPANSVILADVSVSAGMTSVGSGAINNRLLVTTAVGGITPSRSGADVAGAFPGQWRSRLDTGALEQLTGVGWLVYQNVIGVGNTITDAAGPMPGTTRYLEQFGNIVIRLDGNGNGGPVLMPATFPGGIIGVSLTNNDANQSPDMVFSAFNITAGRFEVAGRSNGVGSTRVVRLFWLAKGY